MLTKTKLVLAVALILGTVSVALAANTGNARKGTGHARGSYAQAHVRPSPNVDPSVSRPRLGCDHMYNYDRALDGYSYDLVCHGIDLSPH